MKPATFVAPRRLSPKPEGCRLILGPATLAVLFSFQAVQAQQAAQNSSSQFVQANPNYVTYPQAKPSPYSYPQPPAPEQAAPLPQTVPPQHRAHLPHHTQPQTSGDLSPKGDLATKNEAQSGLPPAVPQPQLSQQPQYGDPQPEYSRQIQDNPRQESHPPPPYRQQQRYADPGQTNQGQAYPSPADQGYADQGYANRGYADQGYANQGYADQGYANQGYADQGYSNQGRDDLGADSLGAGDPNFGRDPQPFAAEQLEQMLAPIALYPDALVAQILAASTYPAQVVAADNWLHNMGYASADQIAYGADNQSSWDPSVKALTAFPQVLDLMNHDLRWTTDLGNAYYNQPQDVLQTIQVMRQRAENSGALRSTLQENVSDNQGYIQVAPVNPAVVYVPQYNPWGVYGQPVSPYPGFSLFGALASFADSNVLRYGLGCTMSAFSHTPFGWAGWALNWLTSNILFNHSNYYSRSTSVAHWGNGGGYYGSHGFPNRTPNGYGRPEQGFNHIGSGQRFGQGYGNQGTTHSPLRPEQDYGYNRESSYSRGNELASRGYGAGSYARPAEQNHTWNRPEQSQARLPIARPVSPLTYGRPGGYGSGYSGNPMQTYGGRTYGGQTYGGRPTMPYGGQQAYRAPAPQSLARNDFRQRSYSAPRSFGDSRSNSHPGQERGGGHGLGGGREQHFKAPKAPRMSGGGGGHRGGGEHRGGGGQSNHHGR
jgi:hypothetical protein